VIAGYSQAALARPDLYGAELPAALLKDLRHIFHSSQHLGRLINDLLDLSKAEIGELEILPELLDARAVLVDAFESMAGRRRAGAVEWRIHAPETLPSHLRRPRPAAPDPAQPAQQRRKVHRQRGSDHLGRARRAARRICTSGSKTPAAASAPESARARILDRSSVQPPTWPGQVGARHWAGSAGGRRAGQAARRPH
jgi:signal transduction histidine kinase